MSVTAYPTLRLKLTQPQSLKVKFLPALPGFNATAAANKVSGPAGGTSTDNAIARWDGTNGKLLQNSIATLDDTGNVVLPQDQSLQATYVFGQSDSPSAYPGINFTTADGTDPSSAPVINMRKTRGTLAAPTYDLASDYFGYFHFLSSLPGDFNSGAGMSAYTTENHSLTAQGCALEFFTTPNGAVGAQTALTLKQNSVVDFNAAITEPTFALTDGATVPVNAALAYIFTLTALGDRTILVPTNAPAAGRTQKLIIRHLASGAPRTLSLTTGAGGFRFGTTITALSQTLSGKTDYIGCLWHATDSRWDVVAYAKGF